MSQKFHKSGHRKGHRVIHCPNIVKQKESSIEICIFDRTFLFKANLIKYVPAFGQQIESHALSHYVVLPHVESLLP